MISLAFLIAVWITVLVLKTMVGDFFTTSLRERVRYSIGFATEMTAAIALIWGAWWAVVWLAGGGAA